VAGKEKSYSDTTATAQLDTSWNIGRILSSASGKPDVSPYSYQTVKESLRKLSPEPEEPRFMQSSLKDLVGMKVGVSGGEFSLDVGTHGRAKFNLPKDIGLDFRYKKAKSSFGTGYDWNVKVSKPITLWRK
tara:strand:- start:152 stop:544 length:393 start_codon:yes stop_codon:yes gene_type:complete